MILIGYKKDSMSKINYIDDKDLYGRLELLTGNKLFLRLRNAVDHFDADFSDAFSIGQLKSKRWLVKELENISENQFLGLGTIFLCAGWYGTLAAMLFDSTCSIKKIRSFDIDETCWQRADTINRNKVKEQWKFKAVTQDIHEITFDQPHTYNAWSKTENQDVTLTDICDTVINTSCEHIHNFKDWYGKIPKGKLVVMQSNNYDQLEEHVNCAKDLEEFETQTPMTKCLYNGTLDLIKYTRYMRIGIR